MKGLRGFVRKAAQTGLKTKLFGGIAAVLIVPALVIGIMAANSAKQGIEKQILQGAGQSVQLANSIIDNIVQPKVHDAEYFSKSLSGNLLGDGERAETETFLKAYAELHPESSQIYYGTKDGGFIGVPETEMPADYDPRKRPWYESAMKEKGKVLISPPYTSVGLGDVTIAVSMATEDGSGVIGIDLKLDTIKSIIDGIEVGEEGYAILLDGAQSYISHPEKAAGEKATAAGELQVYDSDSGEYTYTFEGREKYMSYVTNKLTGWKIGGTIYASEADAAASPIINRTYLIVGICLLLGGIFTYFMIRSIVKPIQALKEQALNVSRGDLTHEIVVNSSDEIGQLGQAFGAMQQALRSLIGEVNGSSEQVSRSAGELTLSSGQTSLASEQVAEAVQEIASGAEKQTVGLERNAAVLDEISTGVTLIAERSGAVAELAKRSAIQAEEGSRSVEETGMQMSSIYQSVAQSNETIRLLHTRSREIGEITQVIGSIAGQTNLLALNAAIEAARAGEQGSGFAVVANEVRKLANQSETAARQISSLIAEIQQDTESVVQTMTKVTDEVEQGLNISVVTMQKLEQAMGGIRETTPQIEDIAATAQQISASVQEVVSTVNELAGIANGNAATSEEVAASAQEQLASMEQISASAQHLSSMASSLKESIGKFKY